MHEYVVGTSHCLKTIAYETIKLLIKKME